MLQKGHNGYGCDLASTLCKDGLRKGDLFVLSWTCKYWSHIMLSQSQCKLNSYSGQSTPYKGLLTVNIRHDSKTHELSAFIIFRNSIPLLGRDWMKFVKPNWNIFQITCSDVGTVLDKNADVVLDGSGVIHGEKAVIHMKDNVCPKFCRTGTVPYAIRKKVKMS